MTSALNSALIGREHPAAVLRAEVGRAAVSHGGLVLVTGEAGIGKTALVTEAAEEARRQGALVLSGSCWDSDNAPGYWPWVQVVRGLRRGVSVEEWAEVEAGPLGALLGEVARGEAEEGFRLFDAVTSALVAVTQRRPVLVVLEDLHWADTASLRLLEFAAQHTWFERVLLVGTYRDAEVEAGEHPLRPLIMPLVAKATTVTLTGLGKQDVGALIARTVGREPDPGLVAEVHRRTGGNPFFVEQTARLWHSGGPVGGVAPGVRDAVRRRLSSLPEQVVGLLTSAAVLGREFHQGVLAAAAGAPAARVGRLLGQAVAARLVTALGEGRFGFTHDLVRETLYEELGEAEARRRHAAVVRAVDGAPGLVERLMPADLARHAYLAGDDLEPGRAVDHLMAAAQDAGRRLAAEEAVRHFRRALERADGSAEPRRRAVIMLELGQELLHQGDREDAWRTFDEALTLARDMGDAELLTRVALTLYGVFDPRGRPQSAGDLLIEAYEKLVRGGSSPEGPLPSDRLAQELASRITEAARRAKDDEALAFSLWARHNAIYGPGTGREREAITGELVEVARRIGDRDMAFYASALRWVALLEQGDPRYLEQFDACIADARASGLPRLSLGSAIDRSIIAALKGRLDEAETLLDEALAVSRRHQHQEHVYSMAYQHRWALRLLQGRFEELDELHRALRESEHPNWRLLEAIGAVQRGDTGHALGYLAEVAAGGGEPCGPAALPLWLRFQAQAAAASGDAALCERARKALAPFAGQWLVSQFGWDVSGPVTLWLGLLDAALERWDAAVDGFTAAHESARRLQALPWSVEARLRLAQALLARGAGGDGQAAAALLDEVERDASAMGMRQVLERVRGTRSGERALSDGAARPGPVAVFRCDGGVWTLSFQGRTVHMPDAKGLRDLRILLERPGAFVSAVELLNPEGGELVVAARRLGGDAVLDEEAKARYRARLAALDEEIDRAAARGDDRRAAEFDRERAALLHELRAAAGLAGRSRRLGDEAERARKTVTARIRDTLRRLDERHPELAAHLREAVSTGATCRYQPPERVEWRLRG
ncbi:hypothetical protein GCM10027168_01370 [Streptomyces capparidis]